jgi:pilus assembly protein CpaF
MGKRIADQLKSDVENRLNTLVSGGTRTGRTTLLNTLGKFTSSDERAFVIENAPEIHMGQDSLIRFEARRPQKGLPPVTIRDFLGASLRDRLDRIILREIFGGDQMKSDVGTLETDAESMARE